MCDSSTIITSATGLAGAIIGAAIGYRGAIASAREHFKLDRQRLFAAVFADELAVLEDSDDETPGFTFDIIRGAFPKHFTSYIAYRSTIMGTERQALTKKMGSLLRNT
ncbi:hypothetical protein JWG39_08595 [Desulforhopalus vacuolatus]|uniref:hypothetical protein n=1 Tax=Desulforhopalus vacuolatus TaxID=40414 RepID=UPI001964B300|nr:hypothetical protein [Desulforhopalus vacuolatus]MBM9519873.1 hypothetical protein [Desulforhopalus vacuolatus]